MINYHLLVAGRVQGLAFAGRPLKLLTNWAWSAGSKTAPTAKLKSSFRASTQRCAPF